MQLKESYCTPGNEFEARLDTVKLISATHSGKVPSETMMIRMI